MSIEYVVGIHTKYIRKYTYFNELAENREDFTGTSLSR